MNDRQPLQGGGIGRAFAFIQRRHDDQAAPVKTGLVAQAGDQRGAFAGRGAQAPARSRPRDKVALSAISGIGESKLVRFGEAVVEIVSG